jgi:hypothetical protein
MGGVSSFSKHPCQRRCVSANVLLSLYRTEAGAPAELSAPHDGRGAGWPTSNRFLRLDNDRLNPISTSGS